MKLIAYIVAVILIFFGVLFVWGAADPSQGNIMWIPVGVISVGIGLGIIFLTSRHKAAASGQETNVTYQIDLPGNMNMDALKCKSCGGVLTKDNISLSTGAPVVTCPFCGTVYQISEEPKW